MASRPGELRNASAVPLAKRGLKNNHATLRAAGFGVPSGATFVWPQNQAGCGLRPRHLSPKGPKKHSCNLAGCRIWRALESDFHLAPRPDGLRTASAAPLAQRGLKKHSCNLVGCGIWRALGGDFRLASRPSGLRIESAVSLAQKALKNIHTTLRAAGFGVPLGATVVWPQGRVICGLRPRRLGPKRHASEGERGLGARQASFVSVAIVLLVAEDDMINQLDAE